MENLSARVIEESGKHFLNIDLRGGDEARIPLSDDRPAEVKKAFNRLILRIKQGPFTVKLNEAGEDLFSQVAREYIRQLNKEVQEVRAEMEEHGLVERDGG